MLAAYIAAIRPLYLATYTRNPAILHMLASVCGPANVFPLEHDDELQAIARQMPNATSDSTNERTLYHYKRYGDGLYPLKNDPAFQVLGEDGLTFADTYAALSDPGTALVVTAKVPNEVK